MSSGFPGDHRLAQRLGGPPKKCPTRKNSRFPGLVKSGHNATHFAHLERWRDHLTSENHALGERDSIFPAPQLAALDLMPRPCPSPWLIPCPQPKWVCRGPGGGPLCRGRSSTCRRRPSRAPACRQPGRCGGLGRIARSTRSATLEPGRNRAGRGVPSPSADLPGCPCRQRN